MKQIPILLILMCTAVYAQNQTGNLPPLQANEKPVYKAFTVEQTAASEVATPAVMDTTKNLDTLILSKDLVYRGGQFVGTFRFANTTDTIKFQQYDLNGDVWVTLPVKYKKRNATLLNGSSWQLTQFQDDTLVANGVLTPVGTNLNASLTLDFTIPNRTNGDIRILRGVQDTGAVKVTYVLPGSRSQSGFKWW